MVRAAFDLALLRNGLHDPTTRLARRLEGAHEVTRIERATLTPHGPGSIAIELTKGSISFVRAWGPGQDWLRNRSQRLAACQPPTHAPLRPQHPAVERALRLVGDLRLPATDTPYHELLPAVLGQRITAKAAYNQWAMLCRLHGADAPGPLGLKLPPTPQALLQITSWQFHRMGIEAQRARALRTIARHRALVDRLTEQPGNDARIQLTRLPGIGPWTAAVAIGVSHADTDALPIGDFHVKHTVAWALTNTPRGSDQEMIDALAPYAGQRWRVVRMLELAGYRAPAFGPKRRVLDIARI